ncbi:unnamed protein product [Heligmosomoides polygyrus]|uniref:NR LBD domain-containing protein n=1 Tax=Heligmosomoides polygyrus TaxID=6339 RepID=A0A183FIL1_HELPZ|nr:unnamed protein product [Heligmosomoides polygyrus]
MGHPGTRRISHRCNTCLRRRRHRPIVDWLPKVILWLCDMMSFWENQLYNTAEWMMHCKQFAQLPLEEKVVIFKNSWMIWQRFERLTVSIELFGWRAVTDKVRICHHLFRIENVSKVMFRPFTGRITEEVTKSCLEISLDPVEVAYVLCTLMCSGRRVGAETQTVAEAFREKLSDDLHDYYTFTTKTPNYAGRLIRIMSIVHTIERSKVMELARIFDIFKVELSEKGMFDY